MEQYSGLLSEDTLLAIREISNKVKCITEKSYEQMQIDSAYHISVFEKLGSYGWTVHDRITPHDPRGWIEKIESNGESAILEYYSENDIDEILDDILGRYNSNNERLYVERAIENYRIGHYTESACFFLALLNFRINKITPQNIHKLKRQCEQELKNIGKTNYDLLSDKPISRLFLIREEIPSFAAFSIRVFVDGVAHDLDSGTEPEYLNRNWLMHGRMTRLVEKFECVQLINSFYTLAEIEDAINSIQS